MRDLPISYGNSCTAKKWSNKTITWEELGGKLKSTIRTVETQEEYKKMKRSDKEVTKDKGGFVGGHLRGNRRLKQNVALRSMLTLDLDRAEKDFVDRVEMLCPYAGYIYSTHGHTPEAPRYRFIIPLTRDITPEEYVAISRYFASEWGMGQFDKCSFYPHQLMYWPTTPSNGEYVFRAVDGEWMDPDVFLKKYPFWKDLSMLPTAAEESVIKESNGKMAEDPTTKNNVVGTFCRTYPISLAIETFLSDIYAPSAIDGRYDFIAGEGSAGVIVYDDKFAYSHHGTDPASGKLCNSFDLVRIHKFGDEDGSFQKMAEFAANDTEVGKALLQEKQELAQQEFDDWKDGLEREKNGALKNSLHNVRLIMENDPNLKTIVFNELADGMEIKGKVPWKIPNKFWRDADDAQLICYVDDNYGTFSQRNYDIGVSKVVDDRSYHPIRNYLESLPAWDGVKRIESMLIDYFGAEDNDYVRTVSRKIMCAAIKRVYHYGTKFDYIVVLNGPQGIGKSTFISKLGGEWYSDSLNISDMNDKTAAEKLQGYWIMEIGELAGMKKADIDKVKAFISRQDDKYRASFGRRVTPHPRQCVFFGTTNSETGFLRDVTGNRRFWAIKTPGTGAKKPWELTKEDVDQMWAEALVYVKQGENLFLDKDLEKYAREEQSAAMEQDDREGIVARYLEQLLPDNWDSMDAYERREFLADPEAPTAAKGTVRRTAVSNIEIWCECFGKPKGDIKSADSYAISAIMARLGGWERTNKAKKLPIYGRQRVYERIEKVEKEEETR